MNAKRVLLGILYILLLLFPILWGAFSRPYGKPATITMQQATTSAPWNTDAVFYPIAFKKGVQLKGYRIEEEKFVPVDRYLGLGYGSVVDLLEIKPLLTHYSLGSFHALQDKLGHYSGYYNFDGVKVLTFYKSKTNDTKFTLAIISDERLEIITESLPFSTLTPVALTKDGEDVIVVLNTHQNFIVKRINLKDFSQKTHSFYLDHSFPNPLYFVGMAFEDNTLYLAMNQAAAPDTIPAHSGGYLIEYSLKVQEPRFTKITDHKIDFMTRDNGSLLLGWLDDQSQLSLVTYALVTKQQEAISIPLPAESREIDKHSALYKDGYFYLLLNGQPTVKGVLAHFYMIDLKAETILNSYSFTYTEDTHVYVRYYQPSTEYTVDELYAPLG